MKYDLNKLRSWGLRYIVCDLNGQLWASEKKLVRSDNFPGHWRVPNMFLPPKRPTGLHYIVDEIAHTVVCSNPSLEESYHDRCSQHYAYYAKIGRKVFVPLSPSPLLPVVTWEDEPYDLIANGIVPERDMKTWPDPPQF